MKLVDVLSLMPQSQEIIVFQGYNLCFIGKNIDLQNGELGKAIVLNMESNGRNITIKLG